MVNGNTVPALYMFEFDSRESDRATDDAAVGLKIQWKKSHVYKRTDIGFSREKMYLR